MRLVPASYKREAFAVALVAVLGFVVCLATPEAPDADARPAQRSTAIVPNGTYGVNKAARGEYILFTVRNRRVRDLEFQIQVSCQASDSPTAEPRFFTAGARAPQGRPVADNGKLALGWEERGGGRLGEIEVRLKFGAVDVAHIVVVVPEEDGPEAAPEEAKEHCDGGSDLNFRRGYELPPMPLTP
jgi:hypothetical protein